MEKEIAIKMCYRFRDVPESVLSCDLKKGLVENKICFSGKQKCLNVIYFYAPKKIYCDGLH